MARVGVDVGATVPVDAGVEDTEAPGVGVLAPVGVVEAVWVGVPVEAVPAGVADAVVPVGVADAVVPVGVDVADAVGVNVADPAATMLVTVALQFTSAPPPLPEPLHWSMFTGSVVVMVDPPVTVQTNPTLVPPFPEPLHCPTVAAVTEVTPGVFAGVQKPGAPVPVITEPMHW